MLRAAVLLVLLSIAFPTRASAQWYLSFYLGGSHTTPADISIDLPGRNTSLTFHDVDFESKSLQSPQYYGYRFGKFFGEKRRFGLEAELIHLKVIAKAADAYEITGVEGGAAVAGISRMDGRVQRYQMTHGLNFILFNVVARRPIGGSERLFLVGRAGAGPTLPHAETTIDHVVLEQYELGGLGVHLSGGVAIKFNDRFAATGEYKWTRARPEIDVDGGTGRTTAVSHQIAVGLAITLTR